MSKYLNFVYKPSERPVPMLAYQTEVNQQVFDQDQNYQVKYQSFNGDYQHIWNHNAYLIYDQDLKTVIAYRFEELSYLVWLLRIINQPLKIQFDETTYQDNLRIFNDEDEFTLVD